MHVNGFVESSWNVLKSSGCIEKREEEPYGASWWFVCSSVCFFQRQKWTEPCISSRWRIQFGFLSPCHVQPINILSFMKTNSSILTDASVHKYCFLLSSQPSFENYSLGCLWRFPGWPKTLERSPTFPCREDYPVIYLLSGWPTKLCPIWKTGIKGSNSFFFSFQKVLQ